MTLEIFVAPRAEHDLDEIYAYVAADNVSAARDIVLRFEHLILLLADRPHLGPPVVLPARIGLRKMTMVPYMVFYRLTDERLEIVRVLHSARDLTDDDFH